MNYKIIDNFLEETDFQQLQNHMLNSGEVSWYLNFTVTTCEYAEEDEFERYQEEHWNWYLTHLFYYETSKSSMYDKIDSVFRPAFARVGEEVKTWIRIKANLYPHTSKVREHQPHNDNLFSHKGAVFSLNTCDGFTRMPDGTKVDSVANRVVIFDASELHNSSTTSNDKVRMNINFNFF